VYEFIYERPTTVVQAAAFLSKGGQALAGGQTLLAAMKQRMLSPDVLVDLQDIIELKGFALTSNQICIGAMATHQEVANNALVLKHLPGLAELAGGIGDKQIRAMGTIGGSVANNDPSACYPSAVLALGANIVTNRRTIIADDFFLGLYSTALEVGELITSINFPIAKRSAYAKYKQAASRFALVGVFVAQNGSGVRVAITGSANGVFRNIELEAALNREFSAAAVANISIDAADLNSDLHASAAYRAHMIKVQTQRAVTQALR